MYWICYEDFMKSPWSVKREGLANSSACVRCYATKVQADKVLTRLRKVWLRWYWATVSVRLPNSFTEEEYYSIARQVHAEIAVQRAFATIRRSARMAGIPYSEVFIIKGKGPEKTYTAGPLLDQLKLNLEPLTVEVGQRWRSLDPRRSTSFVIKNIQNGIVMGSHGRTVNVKGLIKRYALVSVEVT